MNAEIQESSSTFKHIGGDNAAFSVDSDEDEEVSRIMASQCEETKVERPSRAVVVVTGEASESEEEEVNMTTNKSSLSFPESTFDKTVGDLDPSQTKPDSSSDTKIRKNHAPLKYKTLLHKKLRERNISLQRNISELMCHPFQSATHEINNLTQQLVKTQLLIQDLAPTLRQLTNDLFHLEDTVDLVHDCSNMLPNISMPVEATTVT